MKNPIKKKRVHEVNEDFIGMQTVTTVKAFGITIYRSRKTQGVSVNLF
jgi:hypothetical protein